MEVINKKIYLCSIKLKTSLKLKTKYHTIMNKLTTKEEEVMEKIWQIEPCAPKDVQATYEEPVPHINTIATVFQILERKGFLTHEPKGRGYVYSSTIAKEDYGKSKLGTFVDHYFKKSYLKLVSALIENENVTEQELLDYLQELKNNKR